MTSFQLVVPKDQKWNYPNPEADHTSSMISNVSFRLRPCLSPTRQEREQTFPIKEPTNLLGFAGPIPVSDQVESLDQQI